jgi:hypothetical protein
MNNINIISEEPHVHWHFLDVNNKIVLDLGCNKFYSNMSTAEYFVNQGALTVIGVDLSQNDFIHKNFIMELKNIDSSEKIKFLIEKYKPSVMKVDIEGSEKYFEFLENIDPCESIAVEYHDNNMKTMLIKKLNSFGFLHQKIYSLFNENIERIGVIHSWK